jgi:GNAT superfamily N-acetyltransferase
LEWRKDSFILSDNTEHVDINAVFRLLSTTYWASDRTKKTLEQAIKNSISFSLFYGDKQIGFARVITDKVVSSWLLDVVISEQHRGNGLGKWLMTCILEHPDINKTTINLATMDAHEFYQKFHFKQSECMRKQRKI